MAFRPGHRFSAGEKNYGASLTAEDIRQIRRLRAALGDRRRVPRHHKASLHSLAVRFGIKPSQVSKVALGRAWGHVK